MQGMFMNVRIIFGYLFFLLSVIFCAFQLFTFPAAVPLEDARLILQFCSAFICLMLASLAAQSSRKTPTLVISVISLGVCFLALLSAGILAMKGNTEMTPMKYVIFIAYAGLYGLFGLAFSFLAGKSARNEANQNPTAP
jgi:hypothetical protein